MKNHLRMGCALVLCIAIGQVRSRAGWTGQINGFGFGRTSVNVNSPLVRLTNAAEYITPAGTTGQTSVSAAIPPAGYLANNTLPNPATATVAKSKGSSGYIWQKSLSAGGGDSTDNKEIESRITIIPVDCAQLDVTTGVIYDDATEKSGYITVTATATGGTAMLLRGFEVLDGSGEPSPEDYYDKTKGNLVWEIMLVGPFEYTGDCPFKIHFRIQTDKSNLWFATDGMAVSKAFSITCPQNVALSCSASTYPVSTEGGCGAVSLSYDIAPNALPAGVPTLVTATAEDSNHNKVICDFMATRAGLSALTCNNVEFSCFTPDSQSVYSPTPVGACGNVSYTYSILPKNLPMGVPTTVTATGVDANGNQASCTFTALRHALQFNGFFSPIDGIGGTCDVPLRTIKRGSNVPVKFTTSCDGQNTLAGTPPTFEVRKCSNNDLVNTGTFTPVANEWHFNWDTDKVPPANYRLITTLQDGSKKEVVVKLK